MCWYVGKWFWCCGHYEFDLLRYFCPNVSSEVQSINNTPIRAHDTLPDNLMFNCQPRVHLTAIIRDRWNTPILEICGLGEVGPTNVVAWRPSPGFCSKCWKALDMDEQPKREPDTYR